jgi:hypothetical protein
MRAGIRCLGVSTLMAGLALWAYPGPVLAQGGDPLLGTWKLNAAKSKYDPGPAPKSITVVFAAAGAAVNVISDEVDADGNARRTEYTGSYDGKDTPIKNAANADTVALKRIDANTTERTDKKAGKVVATFVRKVSADGKTLTVTMTGTNAKGQRMNNTVVLDRQ